MHGREESIRCSEGHAGIQVTRRVKAGMHAPGRQEFTHERVEYQTQPSLP